MNSQHEMLYARERKKSSLRACNLKLKSNYVDILLISQFIKMLTMSKISFKSTTSGNRCGNCSATPSHGFALATALNQL